MFNSVKKKSMKKLMFLTLMFIGMFLVAASDASAQSCKPGPNQVALFVDVNYQGKCVVLDAGKPNKVNNVEDVGFPNDTLSSVLFGSNVSWAVLYEHIDFKGKKKTYYESIPSLEDSFVGNDTVSSMLINLK